MSLIFVRPDWPAPANVHAFSTERKGGFSSSHWCSLNLGPRCGDESTLVSRNRELLRQHLPASPQWLHQVHGTEVVTHPSVVGGELRGDALVAFPGGSGTLSEVALARTLGIPVVGLGAWGDIDGVHAVGCVADAVNTVRRLVDHTRWGERSPARPI